MDNAPRVVGVVMSGTLDDGTAGLWAIRQCGGTTIVQDPSDAMFPDMPRSALRHNDVDYTLPAAEIAPLLGRLARESRESNGTRAPSPPTRIGREVGFGAGAGSKVSDMSSVGALTAFTCPACSGALWELEESDQLRYRCHTGHAFGHGSLLVEQTGGHRRNPVYGHARSKGKGGGAAAAGRPY